VINERRAGRLLSVNAGLPRDLAWNLAVTASATAAVPSIRTWVTDFREDLPKIDVPVLVVHGDADRTMPLDRPPNACPA
jgi:pimeloyl-ACP methyl ester carboxylesterase